MAETITFGEFWESADTVPPESRERIQVLADMYARMPLGHPVRQRLDAIVREEEPRVAVAKLSEGAYRAEEKLGDRAADAGLAGIGDAFTEWYDAEYAREAPRATYTDPPEFGGGTWSMDERVTTVPWTPKEQRIAVAAPPQRLLEGYPDMSPERRQHAEDLRARARKREGASREEYGPEQAVGDMIWDERQSTVAPGGYDPAQMTPRQRRTMGPLMAPRLGDPPPTRAGASREIFRTFTGDDPQPLALSPEEIRNRRIAENVDLREEVSPSWMPAFEGLDAPGDLAYGNVRGPSLGYASESLISDPRRPGDLRVTTSQETLLPDGETIDSVLTLQEPLSAFLGGGGEAGGAPAPSGEPALPDPAAAVDQLDALTPSDYRAPGAPVPGAAPAKPEGGGMTGKSLGGALVGGAGIAAAIGNTIADFRTTAALEDQLASSAAGDTIARREGALAGSQAQRNIMATSMGRRDISPALALRNAQMAGSRTLSDVYGQAAIASARERRESEAQLAQLRKQRWNTLFGGLTRTAGDVGALLATQGAAEETANMNKRLTDLEASNLNQVGLAPGQRRR